MDRKKSGRVGKNFDYMIYFSSSDKYKVSKGYSYIVDQGKFPTCHIPSAIPSCRVFGSIFRCPTVTFGCMDTIRAM